MLTTTKLCCRGCGADLVAEIQPGQIVTCEYCGVRNMVHKRTKSPVTEKVSSADAAGQGATDLSDGRAPPPGFNPPLSGSAPPHHGPMYPHGFPQYSTHRGGRIWVLVVVFSTLLITGSSVMWLFFAKPTTSPSHAREHQRITNEQEQAERKRRLSREGRKGAQGGAGATAPGRIDEQELPSIEDLIQEGPLVFVSERPLLADIDGDGEEDVVGQIQRSKDRGIAVAAISGKDWQPIWLRPVAGRRAATLHMGKEVILISQGNQLSALERASGAERWRTPLSDAVSFLQVRKDHVAVELRSGTTMEFTLARGAPTANRADTIGHISRTDSALSITTLGQDFEPKKSVLERLRMDAFFCPGDHLMKATPSLKPGSHGCDAPLVLALATQTGGARNAMLLGLGRGGQVFWESPLPGPDARGTPSARLDSPAADLDKEHLAMAYQVGRAGLHLMAARLNDGQVLWHKDLSTEGMKGQKAVGLVLGQGRIYLRAGSELFVFALKDGKRLL